MEFGSVPSFEVVSVAFAIMRGDVSSAQIDEKRIAVVCFFLETLDNPQSIFSSHGDNDFFLARMIPVESVFHILVSLLLISVYSIS